MALTATCQFISLLKWISGKLLIYNGTLQSKVQMEEAKLAHAWEVKHQVRQSKCFVLSFPSMIVCEFIMLLYHYVKGYKHTNGKA